MIVCVIHMMARSPRPPFLLTPYLPVVVVAVIVVIVTTLLDSRYLSHGQEWSDTLRFKETTKIIKYSLNPVWNEEFELPVRR